MKRFFLSVVAGLLTLASSSCSNSLSTPYCVTSIGEGVSSAISENFNCVQVSVSGSNHNFQSNNLPIHKSYYYGTDSELYEPLPAGNHSAGSNKILSQNLKYTIPTTPTPKTGTLDSTLGGLIAAGITVHGLAIFNNEAAPPDTLANEVSTFDTYYGHPQSSGVYHHHAAVKALSSNMNDSSLIGIALDGYLVYAEKCDNGTADTSDDVTLTAPTAAATGNSSNDTGSSNGDTPTSLDRLHGHTTKTRHMSTATYHYHYAMDPAAGIKTLIGSRFRGVKGTVTN